jgi:SPP1 gp7 family putative phage head morphogenesis protein
MVDRWRGTKREALHLLGLDEPTGDSYTFNPDQLPWLLSEAEQLSQELAGALLEGSLEAWDRGIANAAEELAPRKSTTVARFKASPLFDDPLVIEAIERMREAIREKLVEDGLELVTGGVARKFRNRIITALASGEFDGQNPVNVARELAARFDGGDYNWERLARSEIADAQVGGKLDLYREQGIIEYDYETAGDSLVSRICRELEAAGPYRLDDPNAPRPMRDSHPGCRCTIKARR